MLFEDYSKLPPRDFEDLQNSISRFLLRLKFYVYANEFETIFSQIGAWKIMKDQPTNQPIDRPTAADVVEGL